MRNELKFCLNELGMIRTETWHAREGDIQVDSQLLASAFIDDN